MIASGLVTHAEILLALGDPDAAGRLYRTALALHESDGSADSLRAADVQLGLGRLLAGQGRAEEARSLLQRAARNAARELPQRSPELARFQDALNLLAGNTPQ